MYYEPVSGPDIVLTVQSTGTLVGDGIVLVFVAYEPGREHWTLNGSDVYTPFLNGLISW